MKKKDKDIIAKGFRQKIPISIDRYGKIYLGTKQLKVIMEVIQPICFKTEDSMKNYIIMRINEFTKIYS